MHSRGADAVGRFEPPAVVAFFSSEVVGGVGVLVVGFLVDVDGVEPFAAERGVLPRAHGLHFDRDLREERFEQPDGVAKVVKARLLGVFAREEEDMLKAEFTDGFALADNFFVGEGFSGDVVEEAVAAVGAAIGACVGEVERHVH